MIRIVVTHRIAPRPVITVSKPKDKRDFVLSVIHILVFYTLLLASVTWYEKYLSWIFQLTSWVLMGNCYFYTALLYVNKAKNPFRTFKKETAMRILSELLTIIYIMNMSLAYYFLIAVYPNMKGSDAYRQLVIYMYPGLSVLINLLIDFRYTKSLQFREFGGSVILVVLYMAIMSNFRRLFNGPLLTETELCRVAWFDPINLKGKFRILMLIMSLNFCVLQIMFRMSELKKCFKQMLRARRITREIHH